MFVTLEEPKLAKKLIVSLTLRKPKMEMTEKMMDKTMEIMRKVFAFLKRAKKKLMAVKMTIATMTKVKYLVGRILRRRILIRKIKKVTAVTLAKIRATRFSLKGLCDLGDLDDAGDSDSLDDSRIMGDSDDDEALDNAVSSTAFGLVCFEADLAKLFLCGLLTDDVL